MIPTSDPQVTSRRPFTENEKALFQLAAQEQGGCTFLLFLTVAVWVTGLAVAVKVSMFLDPAAKYAHNIVFPFVLVTFALSLALVALLRKAWAKVGPRFFKKKPAQHDTQEAEVFTFHAVEAIRVEEFEDEGSHYFIRLQDGKILFLSGQYLYDYEIEGKETFPCTDFNVVRMSGTGVVYSIECHGTYLPVTKTLKPFRQKDFKDDEVPQDLQLVDLPWAEIEAKYARRKR